MSPKPAPAGGAAVDALLAPAFLENATAQPMSEVRRLRREAEQQEVNLSYTRRLLQGRLDIVRRELQRRAEDDGRSLVDLLPEILAEKGRAPRTVSAGTRPSSRRRRRSTSPGSTG